ncbi:Retrovirus-related Pol polyprotein from transposon 17.6 [Thelohanellus kitauei]|nr:Retrovirus-related Pol polyprotein from transposon 17.6 [Thelohanellus kitauei]KII74689.1 Retrovirus-related Pol polyprotein from transposon 17.6 [Thelohanellus kitauei]
MDLKPEFLCKNTDIEEWLYNFGLIAVANQWDESRQSAIIPAYLRDDALQAFKDSELPSLTPSVERYKRLITMLKIYRHSTDKMSAYYRSFEEVVLSPGMDPGDFVREISRLLSLARPGISKEDLDFFVRQKLLSALPENIAAIIRICDFGSTSELVDKTRIILSANQGNHLQPFTSVIKAAESLKTEAPKEVMLSKKVTDCDKNDLGNLLHRIENLEIQARTNTGSPFNPNSRKECKKCGSFGHLTSDCLGLVICKNCKKRGHTVRKCPYINNKCREYSFDNYLTSSLNRDHQINSTQQIYVPCLRGNFNALIDTGATVSLVSHDIVKNLPILSKITINLNTANKSHIKSLGSVNLPFELSNLNTSWDFHVIENLAFDFIVGLDILAKHNGNISINSKNFVTFEQSVNSITVEKLNVSDRLPYSSKNELVDLLREFEDVFAANSTDLGHTNKVVHDIVTKSDQPIKVRPYRISIHQEKEMIKLIDDMLKSNVIRHSSSAWSAPAIIVKKKDGSNRLCVDYRKLNEITVKDEYSLPNIESMFDKFSNAQYISTLDLQSGYWQVALSDESKPKTAFSPGPGLGLYEYNVVPFGLCNAPATFQRLMHKLLKGLDNCMAYLDDIVIFSESFEGHISDIKKVMERLRMFNLKLKPSKCEFAKKELKFLGFIVSGNGLRPDMSNIEPILSWPTPSCKKDIKSFLGACNYYSKFIKNFANLAYPLYRLLRTDRVWKWDDECQKSFSSLKSHLKHIPSIGLPDPSRPFQIYTDASDVALGAVLTQRLGGVERPIGFASQLLNTTQRRYSTIDRECLAILWGIRKFRHYLYGSHFTVMTDHNPLKYLKSMKDPHGRRARWIMELEEYSFTINHIPGRKNVVADALSRNIASTFISSKTSLSEEQAKDPDIVKTIDYISKKNRNPDDSPKIGMSNLLIIDGILVHQSRSGFRPFIPCHQRHEIFDIAHKTSLSHLGVKKTLHLLRETSFWPNMREDVDKWIDECHSCAINKHKNYTPRAPLNHIVASKPFSAWEVDFTGPLPVSKKGNKYLIVFIDIFTKWIEAVPVPAITAETASKALISNIVSRFGIPDSIHSDQGPQFESKLFAQMCSHLNIKKTRTTPYHPMCNGSVERANKTIKQQLRHLVNEFQNDWDECIDLVLLSLRSSFNESTKFSPSELVYGKRIRLPIDLSLERDHPISIPPDYHVHVQNLNQKLNKLHKTAFINNSNANQRNKRYYDTKVKGLLFNVGEKVFLKKVQTNKLCPLFDGPYIVEKADHPTYLIRHSLNQQITKRTHFNNLYSGIRVYGGNPKTEEGLALSNDPPLRRSERLKLKPRVFYPK